MGYLLINKHLWLLICFGNWSCTDADNQSRRPTFPPLNAKSGQTGLLPDKLQCFTHVDAVVDTWNFPLVSDWNANNSPIASVALFVNELSNLTQHLWWIVDVDQHRTQAEVWPQHGKFTLAVRLLAYGWWRSWQVPFDLRYTGWRSGQYRPCDITNKQLVQCCYANRAQLQARLWLPLDIRLQMPPQRF